MITDNMRAALLMMGAMAGYTFNDAALKIVATELPLAQALFLRGILTTLFIAAIAIQTGAYRVRLPLRDWAAITVRSGAEIAAAYFFVTALFNMPLANATAILQAVPLSVTLAAAVFLGDPVGWRRVSAILLGFCGVLLIIKPGAEGFSAYSLYAIIAVVCVTIRDLATRKLSGAVPSMSVTLAGSTAVMVFFGLSCIGQEWQPLTLRGAGFVTLAACFIFGGYLCSVMVMRIGEISFVAPFRYSGMIWALLLGLVVFGHWPGPLTLLGTVIVVGSGLFMLFRERALIKAQST